MTRSNGTRGLAALVIAAACAALWSGVAVAQQPQAPNELWQEYPLNPEPGSPEPSQDVPRAPSSRGGGEQAGGGGGQVGGGDDGGAAATDEEPFPLVQVALAVGLLLLAVLHGAAVLARRSGLSESLRDRIGAVRAGPPLPARRAAFAGRSNPAGSAARAAGPRPKPAPPAADGGERADAPAERAEVVRRHDDGAGKPSKPPPTPKAPPPPPRKPEAPKPPPASPLRAAKPTSSAKPPLAAKPAPSAKPPRAAKPPPPFAGGAERADLPAEHVDAVAKHDVVDGKPAKPPPKPKAPPAPARKPAAQKPPPAKPPLAPKPAPPAKPPRAAKPTPPVEPPRAAKPTPPAKPPRTAKSSSGAKTAPAAKRPKPAAKTRKPPAPKRPRAERQPGSEQPPPVVPDEREDMLTCSIYWWRDGPVADFYALATGLQGRAWVVDRSPRFEWLAGDFPDEAREAHAALVETLVTAGWRHAGSEGVWYRQRFERPFAEGS